MDPAVAAELRRHRDQIIAEWYKRVSLRPAARNLPRIAVMNNVPALVDEIIDALARTEDQRTIHPIPRRNAEKHGENRLDLGYGLQELGEEYNSLREAFLGVLDSARIPLSNETASVLHGAVDQAHRAGVEYYIQLREERLRQRQSDFLARLIHDFRSPLATILTSIDLVRRPGFSAQGLSRSLDRMERAARRLLFLIEAQLATEEALSGHLQVKEEGVELASVAEDVLDIMRARAEAKGLALRGEVPSGLELKTDRLLLGQVLQNLVDNALKYTDSGSIVLRASGEGDRVRITVEDTGRGISLEVLPVIFDMYKRSEHLSSGHGVGLAVVKTITSVLGGTVEARSEQGKGSCFTVLLPRALAVREAGP
jgi:signal transduction histidine kinase